MTTLLCALALSSCCCVCCIHPTSNQYPSNRLNKQRFLESNFVCPPTTFDGKPIYQPAKNANDPKASAVLILHEIDGVNGGDLLLAERLANEGYAVYLPLLFGSIEDKGGSVWPMLRNALSLPFTKDWSIYSENKAQGINDYLRKLIREKIAIEHPGRPVGVIGLCVTGSFPIALMTEPQVQAVVVAEPATPLIAVTGQEMWSLGLSPEDINFAARRSAKENIPILGFRFETDWASRRERFGRLSCLFRERFFNREIPKDDCKEIPGWHHPVLTGCYVECKDASTHKAYLQLRDYLAFRLKHNPPLATPPFLTAAQQRLQRNE
jgi:dienelactone hydrolase